MYDGDTEYLVRYQGIELVVRAIDIGVGTTRLFRKTQSHEPLEILPDDEKGSLYHLALEALIKTLTADLVDPELKVLVGDILTAVGAKE